MIEITEQSDLKAYPVGTKLLFEGEVYEVVEAEKEDGCVGCARDDLQRDVLCYAVKCTPRYREDGLETKLRRVAS